MDRILDLTVVTCSCGWPEVIDESRGTQGRTVRCQSGAILACDKVGHRLRIHKSCICRYMHTFLAQREGFRGSCRALWHEAFIPPPCLQGPLVAAHYQPSGLFSPRAEAVTQSLRLILAFRRGACFVGTQYFCGNLRARDDCWVDGGE